MGITYRSDLPTQLRDGIVRHAVADGELAVPNAREARRREGLAEGAGAYRYLLSNGIPYKNIAMI